jgi:hypothetical protein
VSIYVEILVRTPIEALRSHTQTPALHERWDLRFSRIEYLPRVDESDPQRFRYSTRIGFGVEVSGEGETVGRRDSTDGSSTSALKFGSDEPLSIITEGSGYWKYIPTKSRIRTTRTERSRARSWTAEMMTAIGRTLTIGRRTRSLLVSNACSATGSAVGSVRAASVRARRAGVDARVEPRERAVQPRES